MYHYSTTGDHEVGATAVEYALMVFLIALAIFGTVTTLGITVDGLFGDSDLIDTLTP